MEQSWQERAQYLEKHGLYRQENEHDACGVGLVATIDGKPQRTVVTAAIDALKSVWHRGAVDADGKTGDGAGIHLEVPQTFFRDYVAEFGRTVPEGKSIAVGMIFLPHHDYDAQETCRVIVETEIIQFGYRIYGWRQVPVDPEVIGRKANHSRPEITQIMVASKLLQQLFRCQRLQRKKPCWRSLLGKSLDWPSSILL